MGTTHYVACYSCVDSAVLNVCIERAASTECLPMGRLIPDE